MPALAKVVSRHEVYFPSHTPGHVDCPACDAVRRRMIEPKFFADLVFPQAAQLWIDSREREGLSPGSLRDYRDCIRRLTQFFSELRLREIHIGHFEHYQNARQEGIEGFNKAGASRINHELNTLSQMLQRANLWAAIMPYYRPLRMPRPRVGCALTEEEEKRLFAVASSKPRWKVAYLCSLLTANTTAGPGEIRMLRLMDVHLDPGSHGAPFGLITINLGAKNDYRVRPIPLNRTAHFAVKELLKRAQELGAVRPEHYLLPHRADHGNGRRRGDFDPTRPQSSWRTAWDKLRVAANLPHLRQYDLRHHVITRLLEDENVSERTVIELAGHVSKKMLERYSHIRMRTKLEGVLALEKVSELPEKKPPAASTGSNPFGGYRGFVLNS